MTISSQDIMLLTPTHPSQEVIAQFLLGILSTGYEEVEHHLDSCTLCTELAARISSQDDLTELLKSSAKCVEIARYMPKVNTNATLSVGGAAGSTLNSDMMSNSGLHATGAGALSEQKPPSELLSHPRYSVIRCIGLGGMGTVWLAEHKLMHRSVAVKCVRSELIAKPIANNRFQREVEAAARLNHPNVVTAHDAERVGNTLFLVTEYLDGETLAETVARGALPLEDACRAARDAARGLAHAHQAGITHRDIKPINLFRTADGTVKILDFGLAGLAEAEETLTGSNLMMGTPDYIAPEQAINPKNADARSDIYSLGCTLYHLLTGHVPFQQSSTLLKIDAHRRQKLSCPPEIPAGLWRVMERMLAKQPDDRFQNASQVAELLNNVAALMATEPNSTGDSNSPLQQVRVKHRWPWLVAVTVVAAVLFTTVTIYWRTLQSQSAQLRRALPNSAVPSSPSHENPVSVSQPVEVP